MVLAMPSGISIYLLLHLLFLPLLDSGSAQLAITPFCMGKEDQIPPLDSLLPHVLLILFVIFNL